MTFTFGRKSYASEPVFFSQAYTFSYVICLPVHGGTGSLRSRNGSSTSGLMDLCDGVLCPDTAPSAPGPSKSAHWKGGHPGTRMVTHSFVPSSRPRPCGFATGMGGPIHPTAIHFSFLPLVLDIPSLNLGLHMAYNSMFHCRVRDKPKVHMPRNKKSKTS